MKFILAILILLPMAGCDATGERSPVESRERVSPSPACPQLPSNLGIEVSGRPGMDFFDCVAKSEKTGQTLFHIYVGNHPDAPDDLLYAGATSTPHGNLAWFRTPTPTKPWEPKQWITFIPTGNRSMSVMMVSVSSRWEDLDRLADLVVQLRP